MARPLHRAAALVRDRRLGRPAHRDGDVRLRPAGPPRVGRVRGARLAVPGGPARPRAPLHPPVPDHRAGDRPRPGADRRRSRLPLGPPGPRRTRPGGPERGRGGVLAHHRQPGLRLAGPAHHLPGRRPLRGPEHPARNRPQGRRGGPQRRPRRRRGGDRRQRRVLLAAQRDLSARPRAGRAGELPDHAAGPAAGLRQPGRRRPAGDARPGEPRGDHGRAVLPCRRHRHERLRDQHRLDRRHRRRHRLRAVRGDPVPRGAPPRPPGRRGGADHAGHLRPRGRACPAPP